MKHTIITVLLLLATSFTISLPGCTPADRQAAAAVVSAAAPIACTLVPLFAGPRGAFAGTVCEDVASVIAALLAMIPPRPGATAPCPRIEPLTDAAGRHVGYMCPAYLETAKKALAGRVP